MKRVLAAIAGTVTGLVLLLGFKTHTPQRVAIHSLSPLSSDTQTSKSTPLSTAQTTTPTTTATATAPTTNTTTVVSKPPTTERTVTGGAANTRYGPVQVQITVSGTTITDVSAIEYPQDTRRDQQINSFAIPALVQETLSARSAQIDGVSGATYTSDGFVTSLQSALSQLGL